MLRRIFRAYLIFLFLAGHVVVIIGAAYVFAKIGSPKALIAAAIDKTKKSSPEVASLLQTVSFNASPKLIDYFTFPAAKDWKGAGASPDRKPWRPAYDKNNKPLANGSPERNLPSSIVATGFPQRIVNVKTTKEMVKAIKNAKPGDAITIAPGKYFMAARSISAKTMGLPNAPIAVRAEKFGTVRVKLDTLEGFLVSGQHWIFENLELIGDCVNHSQCEHAFHVVGNANSTVIRNNRVMDFNAQLKVNGGSVFSKDGEKHRNFPDYGLVEYNSVYDNAKRETGNPVTKLNINGGNEWVVRGNLIADFEKGGGDTVSYGSFMKANNRNGVFEENAFICHLNTQTKGGIRLGMSFGGGGTGKQYCRDFNCASEHTGGIIRNNLILNCPKDVGIYLNRSTNTEVYNNMLLNTGGIDVRFSTSSASIYNNVIDGGIHDRNQGVHVAENNIMIEDSTFGGTTIDDIYVDAANLDFTPKDPSLFLSKGDPITISGADYCGRIRDANAPDIGPLEYKNGKCDISNFPVK